MPVVIRLMRAGAKKRPFYRMVVADSRRQRDGRFIEILGHYNPLANPYELVIHKDKAERWISRGAQPSEQAASLLRTIGVSMQRPSPAKKVAAPAAAATAKPAAKKKSARKPRKQSTRKTDKKAARKGGKKKPAAKKKAKKS